MGVQMGTDPVDAFESLAREHAAELGRLAYQLTGDREAARDLAQDALLDAFRHRDRLARAEHPRAYLRRVLVNRHLNNHRRRRFREVPLEHEHAGPAGDGPETSYGDRDLVWSALGGLSQRQRTALVLRYYVGLDDAESARLMGCRIPTVRSLVSRGLAALRTDRRLLDERGARP
jgi:RNA polymerase sigma-70 factor (sigma-E family)